MSEQSDSAPPSYVTCRCQSCDGHIEFDANALTEEDCVVQCPHCGSDTRLFIPVGQNEITVAEMPASASASNAIRREGFFCGTEAISQSCAADEKPKPSTDPILGQREPFEANEVQNSPSTSKVEIPVSDYWRKKLQQKNATGRSTRQRVAPTAAQSKFPITQELIALLCEVEADGFITDSGARKLREWLEANYNHEIVAFSFLLDATQMALCNGPLNMKTIPEIKIALELQLAIERVLPKQIREPIVARRIEVEARLRDNVPATEDLLERIRELGGNPPRDITAAQARELEEKLYRQPTEKQIKFIRDLGGTPSPDLTRFSAMELIDNLLHPNKSAEQRIQYTRNLDVGLPPKLDCTNIGIQMSTNHFTLIELQQGSIEWLEWRHNGIGASDASTIMGENRFKSATQLLQEKCGPAQDYGQNLAMARGTELEPEARRLYVAKTGREVRPACLQSTRFDWLRASPSTSVI